MNGPPKTVIDQKKCSGCGLCIKVCPSSTLDLKDGKAFVKGNFSIYCGHCEAVCPEDAIKVTALDPNIFNMDEINSQSREKPTPSDLFYLMRIRHSTRVFDEDPVPITVLKDLIRVGITAPSGTNSQKWVFTLIPGRKKLVEIGEKILSFYENLNKKAENKFYRLLSRFFYGNALIQYYKRYYETVKKGIKEWKEKKIDRLFHGAPSAIIISSKKDASCPKEDSILAASHIILMAEALNLGTCLIGFAVEAINRDPKCQTICGILKDETVHAFIVIGKKRIKYKKPRGRKKVLIRTID